MSKEPITANYRRLRDQYSRLVYENDHQRNSPSRGYDEDEAFAKMIALGDEMAAELDAIDLAGANFAYHLHHFRRVLDHYRHGRRRLAGATLRRCSSRQGAPLMVRVCRYCGCDLQPHDVWDCAEHAGWMKRPKERNHCG